MDRTWELSYLELVVWREKLLGRGLPKPLVYTSDIEYHDAFEREKTAVWDRLRANWDPVLAELLRQMAQPDIRVLVRGFDPRDIDDQRGHIRMFGAQLGARGLLIRQLMGESVWHSDGYILTECEATHLASTIVGSLARVEAGAIERVDLSEPAAVMNQRYPRFSVRDMTDDEHRELDVDILRWRRAAVSSTGPINVVQGRSKFGPRGVTQRRIFWQDHVDDGRYAILPDPPVTAISLDRPHFEAMITTEVGARVRALNDETPPPVNRVSIFE